MAGADWDFTAELWGGALGKALNRWSARLVATLKKPGRHADGGGLYATVSKDGKSRRWVFLFRWQGRRCEMGLGGLDAVPLARARELAARCRLEVVEGRNPLESRQASHEAERRALEAQHATRSRQKTFGQGGRRSHCCQVARLAHC
jgi:hypothetical protein